jgi:tetratricopeptide (TPR) repeat protein
MHRLFTCCVLAAGVSLGGGAAKTADRAQVVEHSSIGEVASPSTIDSLIRLGDAQLWRARRSGDLRHVVLAESAAYHVLEIDSTNVPALNLMSLALSIERRFEDVLYVQNWSIVCDLRNPESWGILGDAFMELGKYRNADSCYTRMAHLDQGLRSRSKMARWAFDIGDTDVALARMKEAVEIGESELEAVTETSPGTTTQIVRGEAALAEDTVPEAAARDLAGAYALEGTMLLARGRWEEALESATRSLAIIPGFVPARALEAEILRLERKYAESARIYEEIIATSEDPGFKSALARVYADKGRDLRAAALVREAKGEYEARLAEFANATRSEYAAFLLEWGLDLDKALSIAYEESRRGRSVYNYDLLAWAYYRKGRHELAWSSIACALRNGTQHPRILYHAAAIAKASGDREKYVSYAQKAKQSNPRYPRQYGSL